MASIRSYINILLIVFIVGIVPSCDSDNDLFGNTDDANVSLTLQLGSQPANGTRAVDDPGQDDLNENVMKSVDVFFYTKDAADNTLPVYEATDIQLPQDTNGTATLNLTIPVDKYNTLFPITDGVQGTECKVYVIVNRPAATTGDNALPADHSLSSLRDNTILCANGFSQRTEEQVDKSTIYKPTKQNDFVMDGYKTVTRNGNTITGTIPVERVATKISLVIKGIANEVTDDKGVVWQSDKNSVRLSLRRGSKRTKLGSTPTEYIYQANKDNDIFRIDAVSLDATLDIQENGTTTKAMTTSVPFYTYPTNWKNDENSRTHFILVVKWTKMSNPVETLTTYYEVNVNAAGSYTQRNRHYRIYQEIGVLGSTDEENPVVLYPCNYRILDWGNIMSGENITGSSGAIGRFRYLVVDETNIELSNVSSKEIFFFSSDPVDLTEITVKWENTKENTVSTVTFANMSNATRSVDNETKDIIYVIQNSSAVEGVDNRIKGDYKITLRIHNADTSNENDRSYIYISHPLDNTMDKDADYTPYYIDFKVKHTNDPNYNETVKITQYPMIVIKADPNSKPNNTGGVYVNKRNSYASYGGVHGLNGENTNPNRYIISVSALDTVSSYIIGDPRKSTVDNLNTEFATAPTMKYTGDTRDRALTYYHPTVETSASEKMISPQFMIASSYGVTNPVSKDEARMRCATYQEDGYPAGRWRLPTQAEIQYIVQLSAWGIIPTLFGTEGSNNATKYWSANGAVNVTPATGTVESSSSTDNGPVRCVYDTWYWTDKCSKTTFTWGDKATF